MNNDIKVIADDYDIVKDLNGKKCNIDKTKYLFNNFLKKNRCCSCDLCLHGNKVLGRRAAG